jgi:hypothetical protein
MTREQKCCEKCICPTAGEYCSCRDSSCTCHTEPEVRGEEWEQKLDDVESELWYPYKYPESKYELDPEKVKQFIRETRAAAYREGLTEALTLLEGMKVPEMGYQDRPFFGTSAARNFAARENEVIERVSSEIQSKITSIREDAQLEDANESLKEHLSKL